MIRALRNIDRLYYGARVGRGSAAASIASLLTGAMPFAFVGRYLRGELDDEIRRLCK